ncbi:hypothetical protein [Longispora albida]|uniref:hypothetical protein n=1 Tax=Longispora albida TaxID=203523 RepID=UPI00037B5723|nr:hypothetical protein [Longispora albida]
MRKLNRWAIALPAGIALALLGGLIAAFVADDQKMITFIAFAITTWPIFAGVIWAFLPDPDAPRNPEDTVEHAWKQRAAYGALVDLLTAMALALGAKYALGAPDIPLQVFLVLGLADAGARYLVAARRGA